MNVTISLILLVVALICFIATALGVMNLVAAGLALWVGAVIADRVT